MNYVKPGSNFIDAVEPLQSSRPRRKWPISYRSVGTVAMTFDVVIILFAGIISGILYHLVEFGTLGEVLTYFVSAAVVAAFFVSVMKSHNLYSQSELLALRTQIGSATTTWVSVFLFLSGAAFALKIGDQLSRGTIFSFAGIGLSLLIVHRTLYQSFLIHGLNKHRFSGQSAVLITDELPTTENALARSLLKQGFELNRVFTFAGHRQEARPPDAFVAETLAYLRDSNIEEVIVRADIKRLGDLKPLFDGLRLLPLTVNLVPAGTGSELFSQPFHAMGDSVCIELQREPLDGFERSLKRSFDLLGATVASILLLPLLGIVSVMIKLDSPGPVFFRQKRCGFNGRPFNIFKFRTMSVLEDGPTVCQATQSDSRVTRLGKLLRRTSIDELPQLLNVLNGSMSLVGPRPHAIAHEDYFYKVVSNYAFRHHVKPGVTGWAQVNGHRGATPTVAVIQNRVEFDLWYIDNWSLRLDCLIILRTTIEVIRGRNAY